MVIQLVKEEVPEFRYMFCNMIPSSACSKLDHLVKSLCIYDGCSIHGEGTCSCRSLRNAMRAWAIVVANSSLHSFSIIFMFE